MQHPGVHHRPDDGATRNQPPDLAIGELPVARHKGPAVVMARQCGAAEQVQRLIHASIAKVRDVKGDAQPLKLCDQFAPCV